MAIQTQYRTISEIKGTNAMRVRTGTDGLSVALMLLSTHTPEGHVVDDNGKYVGLVSESELLMAIEAGKELRSIKVEDIMTRELYFVHGSTPIETALKYMERNRLISLPVVANGILIKTVSRHDLLRVMIGAGLGIEE